MERIGRSERLYIVGCAVLLASCGGGGGGGASDVPAAGGGGGGGGGVVVSYGGPPVAGLWVGTTGALRDVRVSLLPGDELIGLYTSASDPDGVAGVVRLAITGRSGNTVDRLLLEAAGTDISLEGSGIQSVEFGMAIGPELTFDGSIVYLSDGHADSWAGESQARSSRWTPDPLDLQGTYTGTAYLPGQMEPATIQVAADGAITGSTPGGCEFSGSAAGLRQSNTYGVSLVFSGACTTAGKTMTGVIPYQPPHDIIEVAAMDEPGVDAFAFRGGRN